MTYFSSFEVAQALREISCRDCSRPSSVLAAIGEEWSWIARCDQCYYDHEPPSDRIPIAFASQPFDASLMVRALCARHYGRPIEPGDLTAFLRNLIQREGLV